MSTTPCYCPKPLATVLLATDLSAASKAAYDAALRLCRASGAALSILHVVEYANVSPPELGDKMIELDRFYADAAESIHSLVQDAQSAGIRCVGSVLNGIAHTEILGAIGQQQVDLAVLGTRALHGFERLVFASTAEGVLRRAGTGSVALARVAAVWLAAVPIRLRQRSCQTA